MELRRLRARAVTFGVAMASLVGTSVPSLGADPTPTAPPAAVGSSAVRTADGLWRVTLPDGFTLTTHGPDPVPDHGHSMGPSDPERPPACASDYYQHVLYGRLIGTPDRSAEVREQIRRAIRRMNAVLNEEALESGGITADYKVLCDQNGEIRVDSFEAPGNDFSLITYGARLAGFDATNADYSIFFDGTYPGVCGVGSFFRDSRPGVENSNNRGGGYAVNYAGCWDNRTPMHENGHNQGAVQAGAPFSTGSGAHCWDLLDVMCYSPDGGDKHQEGTETLCPEKMHWDCGHNDYFDADPEPGEYLADHWNIGSRVNRFIEFGQRPPDASFISTCEGPTCSFVDTSVDRDGTIVARTWDLGDGTTVSSPAVTHTYAEPGRFIVRLSVTDDGGASDVAERTLVPAFAPHITSPAQGAAVATSPVLVSGGGSPDAMVTLRSDGVPMAEVRADPQGAWRSWLDLAQGTYTLDAVASTPDGTSAASDSVVFTVTADSIAPAAPVVATPEDGARVPRSIAVSGTAEPHSTVSVVEGATALGSVPIGAAGTFALDVAPAGDGSVTLAITATDRSGNTSAPTTVSVVVDGSAPELTIDIADGAILAPPDELAITGTALDDTGVARVVADFYDIRGERVAPSDVQMGTPAADGRVAWRAYPMAPLPPGRYEVRARAVDVFGNASPVLSRTFVSVHPL